MCEARCVNGLHAKNVLNIKISRYTGLLSLECSGEISRKIRRICTPYKFAQSECIHHKIKCEIFACKGS